MSEAPDNPVVNLGELPPTPCPCGTSRRAFVELPGKKASLHLVEIREDSRVHRHDRLTEVYYVLEGEGAVEIDGKRHPVKPGSAVMIPAGLRHRAIGKLKILNFVTPAFDPTDEIVE